ncbi:MAG: Calx-beta domain-containing protein [Methylococcaceae bacterium]|nr:Calx-beta domain-containing protein [Methylococcaceae bacterium]
MGKKTDQYISLPDLIFIVLFISSQPILAIDLPSGIFTEWYSEGVKKSEGYNEAGVKEGLWTQWHANGVKKLEGHFEVGKKEGIWTQWYDNGSRESEGYYTHDYKDDLWTTWYETEAVADIEIDQTNDQVTTTLTNTTGTSTVSISGPPIVEEGETTTNYTVAITDTQTTDVIITLAYTGTATAGNTDYTSIANITIPAGYTGATFNLVTQKDNLLETMSDGSIGSEDIIITIDSTSSASVGIDGDQNSVTTLITDGALTATTIGQKSWVSISGPLRVSEGETTSDYTIEITESPTEDLTVEFTYSGTATQDTDYTAKNSIVIKKGYNSATFQLVTLDDNAPESMIATDGSGVYFGSEDIILTITGITSRALETIGIDNDRNTISTIISDQGTVFEARTPLLTAATTVSLTGPTTVNEGDITTDYTVTLTQKATQNITISLSYSGSAIEGEDYTGDNSVVILAGETTATFTLSALDDALVEKSESIIVSLTPLSIGGEEERKKSEFNYVEGKKEGAWREWYNDEFSTLKSAGYFQADKAEDIFTRWYQNGNKKEEGYFRLGQKDDLWTTWYENGNKKEAGYYSADKKDDRWITWYQNGQKQQQGFYNKGRKENHWTFWYDNGDKKAEQDY